jgi:hypothetical protein
MGGGRVACRVQAVSVLLPSAWCVSVSQQLSEMARYPNGSVSSGVLQIGSRRSYTDSWWGATVSIPGTGNVLCSRSLSHPNGGGGLLRVTVADCCVIALSPPVCPIPKSGDARLASVSTSYARPSLRVSHPSQPMLGWLTHARTDSVALERH